jgi:hypothetical protein
MRTVTVLVWLTAVAGADPAATETERAWHVGTNLRTELSTHAFRIDGGVRFGRLDLIGVVDPMVWADGEMDLDAIASWRVHRCGYRALVGWRSASIALAGGRQVQDTLLLGAAAPLPPLGPFVLQFGIELAAVLVKHGGGLPTDVTSFANSTEIGDNMNLSMFLRIGYQHAL